MFVSFSFFLGGGGLADILSWDDFLAGHASPLFLVTVEMFRSKKPCRAVMFRSLEFRM